MKKDRIGEPEITLVTPKVEASSCPPYGGGGSCGPCGPTCSPRICVPNCGPACNPNTLPKICGPTMGAPRPPKPPGPN